MVEIGAWGDLPAKAQPAAILDDGREFVGLFGRQQFATLIVGKQGGSGGSFAQ